MLYIEYILHCRVAGSGRCPVEAFKLYLSHRPKSLGPDSRFYLQPVSFPLDRVWYRPYPMGKNAIGDIGKKMAIKKIEPSSTEYNIVPRNVY
jgi:hypothetical protein